MKIIFLKEDETNGLLIKSGVQEEMESFPSKV
jgi:hypothetical protein